MRLIKSVAVLLFVSVAGLVPANASALEDAGGPAGYAASVGKSSYGEGSAAKYFTWQKNASGNYEVRVSSDEPDASSGPYITARYSPEDLSGRESNPANGTDVSGTFVGNRVTSSSSYGAAVFNEQTGTKGSINGLFLNNGMAVSAGSPYGGAVYNKYGEFGALTGNFLGNYIEGYASSVYGGAVFSGAKGFSSITGDFIGNHISGSPGRSYGGAVSFSTSRSVIGDISGDFIGNYISSSSSGSSGYGGALSNSSGKVGNIKGNFVGNYISAKGIAEGGAIYSSSGSLTSVNGDFIGNYIQSSSEAHGGAFYNESGTIGELKSNFTENYAQTDSTSTSSSIHVGGGAVYNTGLGGSVAGITGNFTDNYVLSTGKVDAYGGAIFNEMISLGSVKGDFSGNHADATSRGDAYGGAVYNRARSGYKGTIESLEGNFTNNYVSAASYDAQGGAVYNEGSLINRLSGSFVSNYAKGSYAYGGAVANTGSSANITAENVHFTGNYVNGSYVYGGAVWNDKQAVMTVNGGSFSENKAAAASSGDAQGGAVYNKGTFSVTDASFYDNSVTSSSAAKALGGAIYNSNTLSVSAQTKDVVFSGNTANGVSNALYNTGTGGVTLTTAAGKNIIFDDAVNGKNGKITLTGDGTVRFNNAVTDNALTLQSGMLAFGSVMQNGAWQTGRVGENASLTVNGGGINLQDGRVHTTDISKLILNSDLNLRVDADLANETLDSLIAGSLTDNGFKINITDIYPITDSAKTEVVLPLTNVAGGGNIAYAGGEKVVSPVYVYDAQYDPENAALILTRPASAGSSYTQFNSSLFAGAAAAQLGGFFGLLNSYDEVFGNMDTYWLEDEDEFLQDRANVWMRSRASDGKAALKRGPEADNTLYGMYAGVDSRPLELEYGWKAVGTFYAGYVGSQQKYLQNKVTQNGGKAGLAATIYKNGFFVGLTLNGGMDVVTAKTEYGDDDFESVSLGVALKTGYHWRPWESLSVQPRLLASYSSVSTENYETSSGVEIKSEVVRVATLKPGLKVTGNLGGGWQPYAHADFVWNMGNTSRFIAAGVDLPELSVKPFVEYGAGLQKAVGETVQMYAQGLFSGGGYRSAGGKLGVRWAF